MDGRSTLGFKRMYGWLKEYENPSYWDTRTCKWLGLPSFANFYLNLNNNKIRAFLSKQQGRVLDIGCGDGAFLDYADVGLDFSKQKLLEAKGKNRRKNLLLASATHLPFRNNVFDLSFMVSVLQHIHPTNREQAKSEALRTAAQFHNIDDIAEKVSIFPRVYNKLRSIHLKPKAIVALLSLLFSFPIDRIRRIK